MKEKTVRDNSNPGVGSKQARRLIDDGLFPVINDFLDCLVVVINQEGKLVYYNKFCEQFTGAAYHELADSYYWDVFCPPEEKEIYREYFKLLDPKQYPIEMEVQIPRKNKESATVLWKYNAPADQNGAQHYHILTGIDITTYKETNSKLQVIGEKYRTMIHVSPVSVIIIDNEFMVKSWSSAAEHLLGWTEKSALGSEVFPFFNDHTGILQKYCANALQGEITLNLELDCTRKDGSPVNVNLYLAPMHNDSGEVDGIVLIALDITERKKAELKLKESEQRYREILESMEDGYYEVDLVGNLVSLNRAAAKMLGYRQEELEGLSYRKICKDPHVVFEAFNKSFQDDKPQFSIIIEMVHKNGSLRSAELSLSLSRDHEGNITGFRGLGRDITERIQSELQLRYLSYHDTLTGVYNRAYFEKEMTRIESGQKHPVAIIVADLDGLKAVNDTHGHKTGDRYLTACADLLKKNLRGNDILARVGGDEFALVLPHTNRKAVNNLLKRIRRSIEEFNRSEPEIPLSVSMGAAVCKSRAQSLEETFILADKNMYLEKTARNTENGTTD